MSKDRALCWLMKRETSYGGTSRLFVNVFDADVKSIAEKQAGAIDNKDGYGNTEAAARIFTACGQLLAEGYDKIYSRHSNDLSFVWLDYLEYRSEYDGKRKYCAPNFSFSASGRLSEIKKGTKLAESLAAAAWKILGRKGETDERSLEDPLTLFRTLRKLKAVHVRSIPDKFHLLGYMEDREPRPRLYHEGLVQIFEGAASR